MYGSKDGYSEDYCTHSHSDMKQYQSTGKLIEVNWEKKQKGGTSLLLGLAFRCGRAAVTISLSLIAVLTLKHQPVRECTVVTLGAGWREGGSEEGEKD